MKLQQRWSRRLDPSKREGTDDPFGICPDASIYEDCLWAGAMPLEWKLHWYLCQLFAKRRISPADHGGLAPSATKSGTPDHKIKELMALTHGGLGWVYCVSVQECREGRLDEDEFLNVGIAPKTEAARQLCGAEVLEFYGHFPRKVFLAQGIKLI